MRYMEDNIEDFDTGCALILAKLYSTFPVQQYMRIDELSKPEDSDQDRQNRRLVVYGATFEFLRDEGFLRCGSSTGGPTNRAHSNVVLTSKGLAALKRTPKQLDPNAKSVGGMLVDFSREMTAHAAKAGITEAMKAAIGGLFT